MKEKVANVLERTSLSYIVIIHSEETAVVDFHLIAKGAEAYIYSGKWFGRKVIKKLRISKSYRTKELDCHLREKRSRREVKLLLEAKKVGVPTPLVLAAWPESYTIIMEYVEGDLLKDFLLTSKRKMKSKIQIMEQLGRLVGKLHSENIIHGDLTTSNVIITPNLRVLIIDFGLGKFSSTIEQKGEEVRVLIESLLSVHYENFENYFVHFKQGYHKTTEKAKQVIQRAQEIAQRGRYTASSSYSAS